MISNVERDIIQLMAEGLTIKQIADKLKHTEASIETYKFRLYKRMKIVNAANCIAFGFRNGLIS